LTEKQHQQSPWQQSPQHHQHQHRQQSVKGSHTLAFAELTDALQAAERHPDPLLRTQLLKEIKQKLYKVSCITLSCPAKNHYPAVQILLSDPTQWQ
jgi:hypothetical protein